MNPQTCALSAIMASVGIDSLKEVIAELCGPVVVVTSGGTSVPLEKNMVRFLDNFRLIHLLSVHIVGDEKRNGYRHRG